jgi:hypothetical protein
MLAPQTKCVGKSELEIHIKFMGDLPAVIGARSLRLRMPAGSTVRSLFASLSKTYGEAFTARVFASPTKLHHYMLIFVDGEHLTARNALDASLGGGEVDVVMLPMFGGG